MRSAAYPVGRRADHPEASSIEASRFPARVVTVTGAAGLGGATDSAGDDGAGVVSTDDGVASAALAFFSKTCRASVARVKPVSVRGPIVPDKAATHCGQSVFTLTCWFQALVLTSAVMNCPAGVLGATV